MTHFSFNDINSNVNSVNFFVYKQLYYSTCVLCVPPHSGFCKLYQFEMGPYFVFNYKRKLICLRHAAKMIFFFLFYIMCQLINFKPGSPMENSIPERPL